MRRILLLLLFGFIAIAATPGGRQLIRNIEEIPSALARQADNLMEAWGYCAQQDEDADQM